MRGLTNAEVDRLLEIEEDVARAPCEVSDDVGSVTEDAVLDGLYARGLLYNEACALHQGTHIGLTALGRLALHLARTVPETFTPT